MIGVTGRRVRPLATAATAAAALLLVVHLVYPTRLVGDLALLLITLGTTTVTWINAARSTGTHRRFAMYAGVASTCGLLGAVVLQVTTTVIGHPPVVSAADALWLASYAAMAAALLTLLRQGRQHDVTGLLDAAVLLVGGLLVTWHVIAGRQPGAVGPAEGAVLSIYPVVDLVLLMLAIRVGTMSGRTRTSVLAALGIGCVMTMHFILLVAGGIQATEWVNITSMVGIVLIAASTDPATEVTIPVRRHKLRLDVGDGIGRVRLAILLAPLLAPALIELHGNLGGEAEPVTLVAGTAVLLVLTFLRMSRMDDAATNARREVASRERFSTALAANSSDAVVVVDVDRRIVHDSPHLAELVGHAGRRTLGRDLLTLVAPEDLEAARAVFARCLTGPGLVFDTELRIAHGTGRRVWLAARLVNLIDDLDVRGVVVNLHDISDRKSVEEALGHQAFHDALTGLPNRALFRDRLDHALTRTAGSGSGPAVIFMDLDGFKTVNDSLGHDAGDELLRQVAARLEVAVRRGDTVGRLGGDEFVVLIEQSNRPLDEATTVADRILLAMNEPVHLGEHQVTLSASLGIAVPEAGATSAELIRDADIAMYQAKAGGKGKWIAYRPDMRAAAVERLELASELHDALDRGDFRLVYQPVIELETETVVGFEALLRWEHPTHGVITPERFIPLAESNGIIVPIGAWVLREATATAARWQQVAGDRRITMAVNVSGRQLAAPDLVEHVRQALCESGLAPAALVLEITETVLVEDPAAVAARLHELRALGVRLAIDDFGTGYSSLSYLRQFPVDILKIDRSFIDTITDRDKVPAIVRGLLELGRTLEMETVAEGVELELQRNQLRDEHCDLAQGYLFARPLPPSEAALLLSEPAGSHAAA